MQNHLFYSGDAPAIHFWIVIYVSAFASWLKSSFLNIQPRVVVGRDARISGPMIQSLVNQTFVACGIDVFDLGLSTTPTVEISVIELKAQAGIIITASHNPKDWNALKFIDCNGEILSSKSVIDILKIAMDKEKLKDLFYNDINIPGNQTFNPELEKAGRLGDFLELGQLMALDALDRKESCGGHFREEYQTEENEAKRNDKDYAYVSAW